MQKNKQKRQTKKIERQKIQKEQDDNNDKTHIPEKIKRRLRGI